MGILNKFVRFQNVFKARGLTKTNLAVYQQKVNLLKASLSHRIDSSHKY